MIIELFSRSSLVGSPIIRAKENGVFDFLNAWSHCAYLDPATNLVVEAVYPQGVRIIPFDIWLANPHTTAWTERNRDRPRVVWDFAAAQNKKPYDVGGVVDLGFGARNWQDPDKWFCSELLEYADHGAGVPNYSTEAMHRIGVRDRWVLA